MNIYNNIDDHNPARKGKNWSDDMIAYIITKTIQAIIKELFIRCRKLNIFLVFIFQTYFLVPKRSQIKFFTLLNNED